MTWQLDDRIDLRNDRVSDADADRQTRTAEEILRRLSDQPGLVLADEVGMGKTYVAMAVAASVLQATQRRRPVVVMVPPAVAEKWPTEWEVFSERCLPAGHGLRASGPVRRGSEFLKLLDDPAESRKHLIFLTHGALTTNLNDPFIRLSLLRHATQRRRELLRRRPAIARAAHRLLRDLRLNDPVLVERLLDTPESRWRTIWNRERPHQPLDDDPVPDALLRAFPSTDLASLREVLFDVPVHRNSSYDQRLTRARRQLGKSLDAAWTESLGALRVHLPLLILDEAHHVKNLNRIARLFANDEAEQDAEALQGPLGNMFEKMLFLTATPFQLGHHELLRVLDRFHGVRWPSVASRGRFDEQLIELGAALDGAQAAALRFERAWSRIDSAHTHVVDSLRTYEPQDDQPETVRTALAIGEETLSATTEAQGLLRRWVVRHMKPDKASRRTYRPGQSIRDGGTAHIGLPVDGAATLPFLLAARAQAITSLEGSAGQQSTRSYFAYGLASSFEAYAETRRNRATELDDLEDGDTAHDDASPQLRWYLARIEGALPTDAAEGWLSHPKMAATVERVHQLWRAGEKALVFCFYVETGRALRSHISRALRNEVITLAAEGLGIDPANEARVGKELELLSDRLLRSDSRGYAEFRKRVRSLATGLDEDTQEQLAEVVTRFMRTPSFLVRFVDLSQKTTVEDLLAGLERPDLSGATLADRVTSFAEALGRKVEFERGEIFKSLLEIKTGGIGSSATDVDPSERSRHREMLVPNVRLANGGVKRETRRTLMMAFNTPFFPEVLVASSVMSEGVDLQQDCRHVIHHDLDWNPSTLEQRTGRVDRIGSKAESVGQPVVVYEPYLGGTHDEKMFHVVKDRERWFGVVMGEKPETGEFSTEREADRVPLPGQLAEELTMDLSLPG